MEKIKENSIFKNFKLGDKVWYKPACPPLVKVPEVIHEEGIQSVGKKRDEFIKSGVCPFCRVEDTDTITKRNKTFPGEKERIKLYDMGFESEYINWKENIGKPTEEEKNLLKSIKRNWDEGYYMEHYLKHGHEMKTIKSLLGKGLIHKEKSRYRQTKYILVPKGIDFYHDGD